MRNWKRLAAVALLSLFVAVAGCAETTSPLEFPDWMLPVPEGTPVREYAPVPRDQRDPGAIVLTEDLVIGGDPESIFYSAPRIEVGSDGTIYALDTQDRSVRAFSPEGELLRKFGREGQGPGEMQQGRGITVAGQHLLIPDGSVRTRILVFSLDGEPIATHQTASRFGLNIKGLPDGTFVESALRSAEDRSLRRVGGRYTVEGEVLREYFDLEGVPPRELPTTPDRVLLREMSLRYSIHARSVRPVNLQTTGERLYATLNDQYEVLAMDLDGTPIWAVRVAWPLPPYPEGMKTMFAGQAARSDIDPETLEYPEHDVAVGTARMDGHGRLYVFPNPGEQPEDDPYVPVDVFSPEGELIVAALGPASWSTAHGDHVYFTRHDEESDTWYVVRSRLTLNAR
jgi:hypothetical protein